MRKGYTVFEILVVLVIASSVFLLSYGGRKNEKNQFYSKLYRLKNFLEETRSEAVLKSIPFKIVFKEETVIVKRKIKRVWRIYRRFSISGLKFKANNTPIFSPTGFSSSLSTVIIESRKYRAKLTFTIVGKVRIKEVLLLD